MKRLFCLFLTLTLLLCACAPDGRTDPTEDTGVETVLPTQTSPTTEPTEETLPQTDALDDLRNNLPIMDGSTSLIPLEAGIRAALYGKTIEEATLDVVHSTTWDSFWNLLSGNVDLVFSVPLSQEQWDYAANQGVTLETVPIAKEGFVFVVNAENPVDTLTQEQLRDIYSGKITNWSEVGGLDEAIIPYQRNNDSGSQNYMITFMGDTPLMDAPTEMRPTSMSGLMDVVALNDNARGAIGYSVYAYAADMYGNGNEIKFIQVDGVAPSKATMASGDYPLLGENIAVFNANEPEDGYVRQLVQWICSYDGQLALAQAGYVTLEDIGFDYTEMTLSKYQGVGTGAVAEGANPYCYTLYTAIQEDWGMVVDEMVAATTCQLPDGKRSFRITGLNDAALLAEIHDFIDQQIIQWAWDEANAIFPIAEKATQFPGYESDVLLDYYIQADSGGLPLGVKFTCDNGYFSVIVIVGYNNMTTGGLRYVRTETATWDLLTGQSLSPEALFCQGVDIDAVLNAYIKTKSQERYDDMVTMGEAFATKRDFAGLTTTGWHLTHETIYFDQSNPYFANGAEIPLSDLPEGTLVAQKSRDFSHCIGGNNLICQRTLRYLYTDLRYAYSNDGILSYALLTDAATPYAQKINETFVDYVDTYYTEDAICGYFEDQGLGAEEVDLSWLDFRFSNFGGRYGIFSSYLPQCNTPDWTRQVYYPHDSSLIFDLQTGEQLHWSQMLLPGWEDHCNFPDGAPADENSWEGLCLSHINPGYNEEGLTFYLTDGTVLYSMYVPYTHLNL